MGDFEENYERLDDYSLPSSLCPSQESSTSEKDSEPKAKRRRGINLIKYYTHLTKSAKVIKILHLGCAQIYNIKETLSNSSQVSDYLKVHYPNHGYSFKNDTKMGHLLSYGWNVY